MKKTLACLLSVLLLLSLCPTAVIAAGEKRVSLQATVEDNVLKVAVYADNAVGLAYQDMTLTYDPDVLQYDFFAKGADAQQVGNTKSNSLMVEANGQTAGTIKLAFVFRDALWDAETFAADAVNGKTVDINAEHFEVAVFWFNIIDDSAGSTEITADASGGGLDSTDTVTAALDAAPCAHENTAETQAVAPTCTEAGCTAGVVCEDCGKLLSGGEAIPAAGHTDEDGDSVCDVCGNALPIANPDDGTEKMALEASVDGEYLKVSLYANHAVGLKSQDMTITYDPAVLEYDYKEYGADAKQANRTETNGFTMEANGMNPGTVKIGFYFGEALWDAETFAADAANIGEEVNINAEHFETAVFWFKIIDASAGSTELTADAGGNGTKSVDTITVKLAAAPAEAGLPGDIDGDGFVSALDARLVYRAAVALEHLSEAQASLADFDGDGGTTAGDARLLLRTVVGLEDYGIPTVYGGDADAAALPYGGSPKFSLETAADDNGVLQVWLYADNGIGLKAQDLVLTYDPAVLSPEKTYSPVKEGADAAQVRNINNNFFSFAANGENIGEIRYSFFFSEELWDHAAFSENAEEGETVNINETHFALAVCSFKVIDPKATETELKLDAFRDGTVTHTAVLAEPCAHENTQEVPAAAATCITAGYTAGVLCSDCGEYISGHEEIPAAGHTDANGDGYCDVCRNPLSVSNPDDGSEKMALKAAAEDGYLKVSLFANHAVGLQSEDMVIRYDPAVLQYDSCALGADAKQIANTRNNSLMTQDNGITPGELIFALAFKDALWDAETFAADAKKGTTVTIDAEHFEFAVFSFKILDPSAAKTSLTVKANGLESTDTITVPLAPAPCEHEFEETETKAATCTEPGVLTRTCKLCSKTEEQEIPALGHEEEAIPAVEPTCTEPGSAGGKRCARCGETLKQPEETPAKGHVWDEGKVTKEPTAEAEGVRTFTCTVCKVTDEKPVEKLIVSETVKESKEELFSADNQNAEEMLAQTAPGAVILDQEGKELEKDAVVGSGMKIVKADGTEKTIIVKGDNDGDGAVTAADARTALRIAVGLHEAKDWEENASLVNGAKAVSAAEARLILRGAVGLEKPADWLAAAE